MSQRDIQININARSDQEARHVKLAIENFLKHFSNDEIISISKRIENPLVKAAIKSKL
ncbi:MAG: hypothetical protein WCK82_14520 [Bacteroidota bacterium]